MGMNLYPAKKHPNLFKVLVACCFLFATIGLSAQTVFWSDNFDAPAGGVNNNNAGVGWGASTNTPNGGPNGTFFGITNRWIIGTSGAACSSGSKLYISTGTQPTSGNAYLSDVTTDKLRATPNISTVGVTGITLKFVWRCDGVSGQDYGMVGLSSDGGTTWNWLPTQYSGANNCTNASIAIPSTYENITTFKIAFRFISNATSCSTCDPPFNIDNIELTCTTCPTSCPVVINSNISTNPTCNNANNGTITISAVDTATGTPLTYTISNGTPQSNSTGIFTNLAPGTYTVSVSNGSCSVPGKNDTIVNPAAIVATPSNTGPYCVGQNMQLNAVAVTNATYAWTGPNNFNIQNPTKNNINLVDSGTYTLVVTVGGCSSAPATTRVIIAPQLVAPSVGYNQPLCLGDTLKLTASNIPNATYNWTGPNNFTNQQNPVKANVTFADSGNYSVVATVNGCSSAPATTHVSVRPIPNAPVASSNSPLCVGDTLKLTSTTIANASYAWSGPASYTAATQNPTRLSMTANEAGSYSVQATVNGCKSASSLVTVVVNPAPTNPTATYNGPLCVGDTLKLNAANSTGTTYAWTGPNSYTSNTQNPEIQNVALTDSGDYTVRAITGTCSSGVSTIRVSIVPPPAAPVASSNSPVCEGSALNLNASNIPGATYNWTGPVNYPNQQNPTKGNATSADAGIYTVVASVGSCTSAPATTTVLVSPAPTLTGVTSNSPVCTGAQLSLSAPAITGVSYSWSGPNSFSDTAQNPAKANITFADSGDYTVVATLGSCTSAPAIVSVSVLETPAKPMLTSSADTLCSGDSVQVCAPNNFIAYAWNANGNNATTACTYAKFAGGYEVTVTSVNGCSVSSNRLNLTTYPASSVSIIVQGDTLSSFGALAYQWFRNDTLIPGATQSSYIAKQTGEYSVQITDQNGCKAISAKITVNQVGIEEFSMDGIEIYPNPASGFINIRYSNAGNQKVQLTLFNVIGEMVLHENLDISNGLNRVIDVSHIPAGVYLLQLQQGSNQPSVKKLIVE